MSDLSISKTLKHAAKSDDPMVKRLTDIANLLVENEDKLRDSVRDLEKKVSDLSEELRNATKQISTLTTRLGNLENRLTENERKNKTLEEMVKSQPKLIENLKMAESECENLRSNVNELTAEVDAQKEKINAGQEKIKQMEQDLVLATLQTEVVENELDRKTRQNSQTGNFPSSFDVAQKSKPQAAQKQNESEAPAAQSGDTSMKPRNDKTTSSRVRTGKPRGAKPGHEVHKKEHTAEPDKIVNHYVRKAPTGAVPVRDENGNFLYCAVQETTVRITGEVTEHRYIPDPKGEKLDDDVMNQFKINSTVYSREFKSFCVFLLIFARMPYNRVVSVVKSITHGKITISEGTLAKWAKKLADNSRVWNDECLNRLMQEKTLYVDETSILISGERHWVHCIASETEVIYTVTRTRGDKEKGAAGILKEKGYKGVVVHDHFASYRLLTDVLHQECNVHISRYMRNGVEFDHCPECSEMLQLYKELREEKAERMSRGEKGLNPREYEEIREKFISLCALGMERWEKKAAECGGLEAVKKYTPPYYRTFRRMKQDPEHYLLFLKDFSVPFGNNRAERCVGGFKSKIRTARQCVTENGARVLADLMSLSETAHANDKDILEVFAAMM